MPHSNYIFHFVSTFAGFHSEIISRLLTRAEFQFRQRFGTWLFLTDVDGRIEAFKLRCEKLMKIESRLRIFFPSCFTTIPTASPGTLCAMRFRDSTWEHWKEHKNQFSAEKFFFPKSKHVKWAKWRGSLLRCCWRSQLLVKWTVSMKQLRLTETYQKTFSGEVIGIFIRHCWHLGMNGDCTKLRSTLGFNRIQISW